MAGKCVSPSAYGAGHAGGLLTSQNITTEGSIVARATLSQGFYESSPGEMVSPQKPFIGLYWSQYWCQRNNSILIDARDRSNQYDEVQKRHVCNTVGMQH
eukprot:scaffold825_cov238-Chaetoceros_neogracile.AAC.10